MYKFFGFLIVYIIASGFNKSWCQYLPAEGAKLHYRIVGFSFQVAEKNEGYLLEVASGNYTDDARFKNNIICSKKADLGRQIFEVPAFGAEYTWRAISAKTGKTVDGFHHFSTMKSNNVDTQLHRLRMQQTNNVYRQSDAFVFTDGNKVLYNMSGEPVWFLPNIKGIVDDYAVIRDLKVTPRHTITFLTYNMAYEINYDAEVLWKGPNNGDVSGDATEAYHHEITRMNNGHYFVLGHETLAWDWKHNSKGDSSVAITGKKVVVNPNGGLVKKALMGTVIEYDEKGNVVWNWKSSSYYKDDKMKQLQSPLGLKDAHENAFFFDEKNKMLYVSFKNTNQVLKIKYPEGKVVDVYDGTKLKVKSPTGSMLYLFSEQHACKINSDGFLYLYNNNMANSYAQPEILVMQQPAVPNGKLKTVWQYQHNQNGKPVLRELLTSGGNVIELPHGTYFASSCSPYANVFIVNKNKQLLWDATLEKWDVIEKKWMPLPSYRASIIPISDQLYQMIWASQKQAGPK